MERDEAGFEVRPEASEAYHAAQQAVPRGPISPAEWAQLRDAIDIEEEA